MTAVVPGWPHDGQPRFKPVEPYGTPQEGIVALILDRAHSHKVVWRRAFNNRAGGVAAETAAATEAHRLNQDGDPHYPKETL